MNRKRGPLNNILLPVLLLLGLLLAVGGCADPSGDDGSNSSSENADGTPQASATLVFAPSETVAGAELQPLSATVSGGQIADVTSIALTVNSTAGGAVWYSGTVPAAVPATSTSVSLALPAGVSLDFSVSALNASGTAIFSGILTTTLSAGANQIILPLSSLSTAGVNIPSFTSIVATGFTSLSVCTGPTLCPGDSVSLIATVSGTAPMTATFQDVVSLAPAGFQAPLTTTGLASGGTAVVTWKVPSSTTPAVYQGIATVSSGTAGQPDYVATEVDLSFPVNVWTWISGGSTVGASGSYGTKGTAAATNLPGAREGAVSWKDASGKLWLFGGSGYDSVGSLGDLDDLWKYDGTNWTWVSGNNTRDIKGTYGTKGTAAAANIPGTREYSVSWIDASGNLWLFGGNGYNSTGTVVYLNDLWKFNGTQWTWISGTKAGNTKGTYGTKGTAAAANVPGAREYSVSWIDASGNLWMFGGYGDGSTTTLGYNNDLWKFNGTQWTWISGSKTVNTKGTYGTKGTAAAANVPGAREYSVSWIDASGNLWLFGGYGYDSAGSVNYLNDLWKFDGTNWTWVSGSNTVNATGSYGTLGTASASNVPGARYPAASWIDAGGNRWLFGGYGYDSAGSVSYLNDLWKFDGTNWTWVSGSNIVNATGSYGTLGTPSTGNAPGARDYAVPWIDASGNRWFFGGYGYDSAGTLGYLNDLWRYQP